MGWKVRYVADPHSRFEATTLIEAMHARVGSAALKQDVIAIPCPSLGQSGLDNGATMALPTKLAVSHDILEEPVSPSAAQKIRSGDERAGRCDPGTRL